MVTVTKYVWDPVFDCVTHELDENNNVKAEYHNEPQPYGGVLSQRRGTTTHYHHHDALGSTRFLTDSSGNVTDTYLHDACGNLVASTGTTINPFKWVGKYGYYTDNSTAQVYVRARMYQPTTARWTTMDPAFPADGLNSMLFVGNQPHSAIDASGLACTPTSAGALQYIPDRGMFDSSLDTLWNTTYKIRAEFFTRMDTTFITNNAFADGMTCSCCCEVLGLVQTVKQTIHYRKIIQPRNYKSHDWRLDDAICGIPYSKSSVTPPCRTHPITGATKGGMRAMMEDTPGVQFPLFAGYLSYVSQDFETCALCINSKRLFPPDEGMLFDQGKISGATAYGCFTWGHSFKATSTSPVVYRWKRYINDQVWSGEYKTGSGTVPFEFDGPLLNLTPKAPSADFKKVILNASVDLSGCWGSAVTPGMPD